ncbi:hypothetical protein A2Z33_03925 [Candidatus Gottesmanbacteria bacterium RBG_16_52_11]|uniref:Membrane protein 6-pyruvoyl-tetrahydropterin synthase-related domain-containing protein n=1 Tax=Candidatus Gottesmanbacteria bacterium RBG_16_52_11 TaxID=1798374 RepID=A0A1F5YVP5_9BACT|nr:MAG: hypothetical protein A2Z33_03925 [Candidatus Gottesmanbacteria bacterium RBG_16_52_11]
MKRTVSAVFLFAILSAILLWPALAAPDGMMLAGYDLRRYFYFIYRFWNEAIGRREFPWWNPYLFNGIPFAANPKSGVWYPLNWILAAGPVPRAFAIYIWFHLVIAMTGMYRLLKLNLKTSGLPAAAGGVLFGLSGFFGAKIFIGGLDMIAAASYIPWVFGAWWPFLTGTGSIRRRQLMYPVIVTVVQFVSGYQTISLFTWMSLVLASLVVAAARRTVKPLIRIVLGLAATAGFLGFTLLPNREYLILSLRSRDMSYERSAQGALTPELLAELVRPDAFGGPAGNTGPMQFFWERAGYIGVIGLVLAVTTFLITLLPARLVGSVRLFRESGNRLPVLIFSLTAVLAVWISLGPNAPVDMFEVFYRINPVYRGIRIPARHMVLFTFSASALAGLLLSRIRRKGIVLCILILATLELLPAGRKYVELAPTPAAKADRELVSLLVSDPGVNRLMVNYPHVSYPTDSLDTNQVLEFQIRSTNGYETGQLRAIYELAEILNGNPVTGNESDAQVPVIERPDLPFSNVLGGTYVLVDASDDPVTRSGVSGYIPLTDRTDRPYRLYRNPAAAPRHYLVTESDNVQSSEVFTAAVRDPAFSLGDKVIGYPDALPPLETTGFCNPYGRVETLSSTLNSVTVAVDTGCPAYLVSTETMYPGWRAWIDGTEIPVYSANGAFRTIIIPPGSSIVRFEFFPRSFVGGSMLTVLTLVVLILLPGNTGNLRTVRNRL